MRFDPEQRDVDWDGLWTMLLSCTIILLTAAIPFFFTTLHIFRLAKKSPNSVENSSSSCLLFGKKLINGTADNDYRLRLEKALQLIQKQPNRLILLLGGTTSPKTVSEAAYGLTYLQQHGAPEGHNIRLEEQSKNTLDNLKNAQKVLQHEQISQVTLISNRYHLARCQLVANSLKINHKLCAAEESIEINLTLLLKLLIEGIYIHWFIVGKYWARISGNKRMLQRVT